MNRLAKIFSPFLAISIIIVCCFPVISFAGENDYTADIRWDFDIDAEGFEAEGCELAAETDNDAKTLCVSNINEGIIFAEVQNVTDAYKYMRIRMKAVGGIDEMVVKLSSENGRFYGLSVPVYNRAASDFAECEIDLADKKVRWISSDTDGAVEDIDIIPGSENVLNNNDNVNKVSLRFVTDDTNSKVVIDSVMLTAYEQPEKNIPLRWNFEKKGDAEGFKEYAMNGCGISITQETVDGAGCLKIAPRDGCDKGYADISLDKLPSSYKYLRFRLKNVSKVWNPSIRLIKSPDTPQMKQWSVRVQIPNNNENTFTDYMVKLEEPMTYIAGNAFGDTGSSKKNSDCAANMADIDEYDLMRFFFEALRTSSGNEPALYFDFIELRTDEGTDVVTPPVISIEADGKKIPDFNHSTDKYSVVVNYKTYDLINEDTVSDYISVNTADEAILTGIRYKETEAYKIADIGARAADGTTRGYRIVMTASERPYVDAYLDVDCEIGKYGVTATGYLTSDNRRPISIRITNITDKKIVWLGEVMPDETGYFSKYMGILNSEISGDECTLQIEIDAKGIENVYSVTKRFVKSAIDSDLIQELCMAADLSEYINDNAAEFSKLGVWADKWVKEGDGVTGLAEKILESEKAKLTIDNAAEGLNGAFIVGALSEMSSDEISALILKYDKEIKKIAIVDNSFSDFDEDDRQWIAANMIKTTEKGNRIKRLSDFEDMLKESMLLCSVNSASYGELCDLLIDNEDVLGISLTKMKNAKGKSNLTDKMKALANDCKEEPFEYIDDLVERIESVQNSLGNSTGSGQGSSSAGGGGNNKGFASVSGSAASASDSANDAVNSMQESGFIDMSDYLWAADAVEHLKDRNIVSGVGDRRFEPGRAVTREEFVKLTVEAFGFNDGQAVAEFTDVDINAWYAPYISAAVASGIITGFTDGSFGVGESITREDMAVIIHRAIGAKLNVSDKDLSFADTHEISDYAKDAVKALSACDVINGIGDNMFAPKAIANRAEAAVIIYRCMNINE